MYVGLLYSHMLIKLFQHPKRMTLVGALAAFCELVPGAEWFPVDRARWATLQSDPRVQASTKLAVELQFALSFVEVGERARLDSMQVSSS